MQSYQHPNPKNIEYPFWDEIKWKSILIKLLIFMTVYVIAFIIAFILILVFVWGAS